MRGFPKNLNTKEDYEYILANFVDTADNKAKVIAEFEALTDSVKGWFFDKNLPNKDAGINDELHKVVENTDMGDKDAAPTYAQYVLRDNQKAKIFDLGYTVNEVKAIIANLKK